MIHFYDGSSQNESSCGYLLAARAKSQSEVQRHVKFIVESDFEGAQAYNVAPNSTSRHRRHHVRRSTLIVVFVDSKIFLHICDDCRIFREGEWEKNIGNSGLFGRLVSSNFSFDRNELMEPNDVDLSSLIVKFWEVKDDGKAVVKYQFFTFGRSASATHRFIGFGPIVSRWQSCRRISTLYLWPISLGDSSIHQLRPHRFEGQKCCNNRKVTAAQERGTRSCYDENKCYRNCRCGNNECCLITSHWFDCEGEYVLSARSRKNMWWRICSFGDSYYGDALQYAKQIFSARLLQMTKYCVMRECDNILHGYRCVFDLAFSHLDGIYGFKFPSRFLEISCGDLTSFFSLTSSFI